MTRYFSLAGICALVACGGTKGDPGRAGAAGQDGSGYAKTGLFTSSISAIATNFVTGPFDTLISMPFVLPGAGVLIVTVSGECNFLRTHTAAADYAATLQLQTQIGSNDASIEMNGLATYIDGEEEYVLHVPVSIQASYTVTTAVTKNVALVGAWLEKPVNTVSASFRCFVIQLFIELHRYFCRKISVNIAPA